MYFDKTLLTRDSRTGYNPALLVLRLLLEFAGASILLTTLPQAEARPSKCIDAQGKITYSDTLCPGSRTQSRDQAESASSPGSITPRQVGAMLAEYDQASKHMDVDKSMSYFADDAKIEIVLRVGHRTGRRMLHKRELTDLAKRHKGEISDYSFRREKISIEIAASGAQAETRSTIIENWSERGQAVTMTSEEQNLIELRDGKLQIIHAYVITDGGPKERR